ncbi:XRE family transcriptional regulator [Candidatus Peregrinibacteria bacterium]|nr:MAG: XRE family transcriptional regulator [Candidatus Peregrinibacteria bacterium]
MRKKRKLLGISQEEIAQILGVSRPTVIKIEKGERALKPNEAEILSVFFANFEDNNKTTRINIPEKNINKFKQVLLYILEKVGAKPNIGQTVLYKLLYFIDFDYYEKYETQLMGLTYFKNTHGPVPREFKQVIDEMKESQEIEEIKSKYFKFEQTKYLPVKTPNLALLNGQELEMIESVLDRYADKTATEISEMSHRDTPWKVANDMENLEYEQAFYRPDEFSVREYEAL